MDRGTGHRLHARDRRVAGALLRALRSGRGRALPRRSAARPASEGQAADTGFRTNGSRAADGARGPGPGRGGPPLPALQHGGGACGRWIRPAGRRHYLRRHCRHHGGRGRRGYQGPWRCRPRRRIIRLRADDRARAFQLAPGQSHHRLRCFAGARAIRGSVTEDGGVGRLAPIVASQGGNATTQTMTVAVRALATRDLTDSNAWRVITRELLVGLLNGIAFAIITGVAAYVWFRVPGLGLVIGLAMICNLVAAALGGILIPLVLN